MEMRQQFPSDRLSYIIGDVRDEDKVRRVLRDNDEVRVFHMAALKHVHTCEYCVLEGVKTNVQGTAHVIQACIDANVTRAVLVSTDKAVEPTTAYGAMKMCAERLFIGANQYAPNGTAFHVVRYGNVLGSQGSVVQAWSAQSVTNGYIKLSDPAITRFWWTPEDAAQFVYQSMEHARRGDVLVPLMAACSLEQLASLVAPGIERRSIATYDTEKRHEVLLFDSELQKTTKVKGMDALRVSYMLPPPPDERQWTGGNLRSSDCICTDGVRRALTSVMAPVQVPLDKWA